MSSTSLKRRKQLSNRRTTSLQYSHDPENNKNTIEIIETGANNFNGVTIKLIYI